MPLMGLIFTTAVFSVIAVIMLSLIRPLGLHAWSFIVCVLCEYAGAGAFSMIYTPLIADPSGELHSGIAVVLYFLGALLSAAATGILVVWLVTLILRRCFHRHVPPTA